jgi:hypothetical protein
MSIIWNTAASLLLAACVLGSSPLRAQSPRIVPLNQPRLWRCAEFRAENIPAASNNFDPDEIRLDATFTLPSGGRLVVPAFWYQDFTRALVNGSEILTPVGAAQWRIRFTPTEPGAYTVSLQVSVRGTPVGQPAAERFAVPAAAPDARSGWVTTAPNRRDFETSPGQTLRLIGENVCWSVGRGTYDYDEWFGSMHRAGENFARVWMSPWWAGLEHTPGTLNRYKLDEAWKLDHVFQQAEHDGIYLLFCFDHHGMFQRDSQTWSGKNNFWGTNPYNVSLGGPCAQPNDFFADPKARMIYQKRLRYLVGRYGFSPNLLAWQLLNEIDNVYGSLNGDDVAAWHREMGQWFHAHDPFHHLVTTSLTSASDRPEIWKLPELDFAVYHSYNEAAPERRLSSVVHSFLERYDKPAIVGEFGVAGGSWNIAADPHLRGFRQALWAGALSGSVGTSMSWWWDEIHQDGVYPLYSAMNGLLRRAGWQAGTWTPVDLSGPGAAPAELGNVIPGGAPFDAQLALNSGWRNQLSNTCGVSDRLAAERSAESLPGFLFGTAEAGRANSLRVAAWFDEKARLVLRAGPGPAEPDLIVRVDGAEALRTGHTGTAAQHEAAAGSGREFSIDIPAGKRSIEIANAGAARITLEMLRLERIKPSSFAGGWQFLPEAVGLRNGKKGILYVCSPWVVYPAGALRYNPPHISGQILTLKDWPAGRFAAQWFDPATGAEAATTVGTTVAGTLVLPLPDFQDDLVGVVTAVLSTP